MAGTGRGAQCPVLAVLTTFEDAFRTHFPERRGLAMHSRTPRVPQSKKKLIELPAEAWRAPNNSRMHERDLGCSLAVRCRIPTPNHVFIWSVNPAEPCSLQGSAGFPLQIKCSFGVGILQSPAVCMALQNSHSKSSVHQSTKEEAGPGGVSANPRTPY